MLLLNVRYSNMLFIDMATKYTMMEIHFTLLYIIQDLTIIISVMIYNIMNFLLSFSDHINIEYVRLYCKYSLTLIKPYRSQQKTA